nr:hypothetical protein [Tanacetum cinerariifolium]
SLKANLQHIKALSTTKAGYMTFTKAWKKKIWLKGLLTESRYELRLVAGIATSALVKGGFRSEVPAQVEVVAYEFMDGTVREWVHEIEVADDGPWFGARRYIESRGGTTTTEVADNKDKRNRGPKKTGLGEVKNLKKPSQALRGVPVGSKKTLVDDEGEPVKSVVYLVDHDSEDEVASVDNNMLIPWRQRGT